MLVAQAFDQLYILRLIAVLGQHAQQSLTPTHTHTKKYKLQTLLLALYKWRGRGKALS